MTIRLNHGKLVLILCLFYIVVSPLNEVLPVSMNRILTALFIGFEIVYALLIRKKARSAWVLYLLYWGAVSFVSCLTGPMLSEDLADAVYMINAVLMLELILDAEVLDEILDCFRKHRRLILASLFLALLLIGISALDPDVYEDNGALRGYMYNSHSMASTAILIMTVAQLCVDARGTRLKRVLCAETLLMVIGMVVVLATKGRTFLIPAAILLWRYLHMLPLVQRQRNLVAVAACVLVAFVLWDEITEKFIEALNNPYARNTMAAITNFRSELWICDLEYFAEQGFLTALFGNGFSFVRELHEVRLTERLWSHNDLTYVLVASGLVGLTVYITMYIRVAKAFCRRKRNLLYFGAMVLFPMLVNGFYIYIPLIWAFLIMRVSLYSREKITKAA